MSGDGICESCGRPLATEITRYGGTVPSVACAYRLASGAPYWSNDSVWLANCYGESLRKLRPELEACKGVLQNVYAIARLGQNRKAEALCEIMLATQDYPGPKAVPYLRDPWPAEAEESR